MRTYITYLNVKEVIQAFKKINGSKKQHIGTVIHKTIMVN